MEILLAITEKTDYAKGTQATNSVTGETIKIAEHMTRIVFKGESGTAELLFTYAHAKAMGFEVSQVIPFHVGKAVKLPVPAGNGQVKDKIEQ